MAVIPPTPTIEVSVRRTPEGGLGIQVDETNTVASCPGQPDLAIGDRVVAINGEQLGRRGAAADACGIIGGGGSVCGEGEGCFDCFADGVASSSAWGFFGFGVGIVGGGEIHHGHGDHVVGRREGQSVGELYSGLLKGEVSPCGGLVGGSRIRC